MYNMYSNEFQGICIGFDWEKFDLLIPDTDPPIKNRPYRVIYKTPLEIKTQNIMPDQFIEICTSKLPEYAFEKEWRMFYTKGKLINDAIRKSIKEIIFGHKVNVNEILQIKNLIDDINGINFFIARLINNKVEFEPLY